MATVTGYTAERMKQIEDSAIVDGDVVGDNLILKRYDNSEIDAGSVRGPQGIQGPVGSTTIPAGVIMLWSAIAAPSGWLIADGTAVSRTTYATLFTAISTTYGVGNGSTTFNLPNLKGRIPVGTDTGQVEFNTNGKIGGSKTHILIPGEMPSHTHSIDPPNTVTDTQGVHIHGSEIGGQFVTNVTGAGAYSGGIGGSPANFTTYNGDHAHNLNISAFTSGSNGSSSAHNNLQPYISLPYIVKT